MISKTLKVSYYTVAAEKPSIISPKNDSHWTNSRTVTFSWNYNGRDTQHKFKIQIFKIPTGYFSDDDVYWNATTVGGTETDYTSQEIVDQAYALGYISTNTLATYVYDTEEVTKSTFTHDINLTTFLPDDGDYYWRIQTKGFVAENWSLFADDGLVRLDAGSPSIKNISAGTVVENHPSIAMISDLSAPHMYIRSGSDVHRGISDGSTRSGLYIYYDYEDGSIVLRGRGGNSNQERYYGTITFHSKDNADVPDPDIYVRDVVDYALPYKIDRNQNWYGPFEQSNMADDNLEWNYLTAFNHLIENGWGNVATGNYIPEKFPSFLTSTGLIYGTNIDLVNLWSENFNPDKTAVSIFPFYSFRVVNSKSFTFPADSTPAANPVTYSATAGGNLIEMRYPPPYQDVFFLFDTTGRRILCFGQYEDWQDVSDVMENPLTEEGPFNLIRGWDVENYRSTNEPFKGDYWSVFEDEGDNANVDEGLNNPYDGTYGNGSISHRIRINTPNDGYGYMPSVLKSNVLYFNISNKSAKDSAIKIKLNPQTLKDVEGGVYFGEKLHSISVHMSPENDCSFPTKSNYRSNVLVDDVMVGRAAVSPRSLSVFDEDQYDSTGKVYFKNVMNPIPDTNESTLHQRIETTDFAIASTNRYFVNTYTVDPAADPILKTSYTTVFNGSFKIHITPEYEYVPYYYPGAVSYLNASDQQAPVPHVFNIDAAAPASSVIGWDSVYIKTSTQNYPDGLPWADLIYPNDYIQFLSGSTFMGQINPYLTGMTKWDELNGASNIIGKMANYSNIYSRIFHTKISIDYGHFGDTISYDGFSNDGIQYNRERTGLFGICDFAKPTTNLDDEDYDHLCNLYLKEFTNLPVKRSIKFTSSTGEDVTADFTDQISPDTFSGQYGFVGNNNVTTSISTTESDRVPAWTYVILDDQELSDALINADKSYQGYYGTEGISIPNWMVALGVERSFSCHYLIRFVDQTTYHELKSEQNVRLIGDAPETGTSLFLRNPHEYIPLSNGDTGEFSGDLFSMGNVFGVVHPDESNERTVRIYFDVEETISGINQYRYLIQKIDTEFVSSDLFGNFSDSGTTNDRGQVKVQKINNYDVNYSNPGLSTNHISNYNFNRSSTEVLDYLLANDARYNTWSTVSNAIDRLTDTDSTGYGIRRLYCDVAVPSRGHVLIHFQVKDKAGNISGMSTVAMKVPLFDWDKTSVSSDVTEGSSGIYSIDTGTESPIGTVETGHTVVVESGNVDEGRYSVAYVATDTIYFSATAGFGTGTISYYVDPTPPAIAHAEAVVDEAKLIDEDTTVGGGSFKRVVYRSDKSASRSISLKSLLYRSGTNDGTSTTYAYTDYNNFNDLMIGFSDDYGLHYNGFAPYSSLVSWDFSRPIGVRSKSFSIWTRIYEPDWLFDPNDIRHYSVETANELALESYSNNLLALPGNGSGNPITIIGLMDESNSLDSASDALGKANILGKKIYEFKEELIGKKLVLGSDLTLKFDILHIFKASNVHAVRRISTDSSGNSVETDIDPNIRNKVWIVVEDPDALCAMILSRRFQYYPSTSANSAEYNTTLFNLKNRTGWRERASSQSGREYEDDTFIDYSNNNNESDPYGDKVWYFGYPASADVEDEISEIVDDALDVSVAGSAKTAPPTISGADRDMDWGQEYFDWLAAHETFYIDPSLTVSESSSIGTNEGWMSQIFKRYNSETVSGSDYWEPLRNHNIVGIEVFDRLVFGESYLSTTTISAISASTNLVTLSAGRLHYSMGGGDSGDGLAYGIQKSKTGETTTTVETGTITDVSTDGRSVIVSSDLDFTMDPSYTYSLVVTVDPLQSTSLSTGEAFDIGWWPSVDGLLLAPDKDLYGSAGATDTDSAAELQFAVISFGSFYIEESGYYSFKLTGDDKSYADFTIDYMRSVTDADITGVVYNSTTSAYSNTVVVGGSFVQGSNKTFYLKKGWHQGRFRYHSAEDQTLRSIRLLFRSETWDSDEWVPFMASRNSYSGSFWAKNTRTIHGKLLDNQNNRFPLDDISNTRTTEAQYLRAILGFDILSAKQAESYADRALWVERNATSADESLTQATDPYYHGKVSQTSFSSRGRSYGAQVFEEAYATYDSNVFDGGADLRFWREIRWSPTTQPTGTSVEFYIRTAATEEELIGTEGSDGRTWNNVGTESSKVVLDPFTDPNATNNLLKFTQQFNTTNEEENVINRFIQFRMVLRSRNQSVVPRVDDVTIVYSKENSVNFFTTTFNLESNLIRAILTYNGESSLTTSDVALSEIQFGICTTEEADGTVSTNFDDYTSIPTDEVFDLDSIGVTTNDKFRVGIRFVSASEHVPRVDEFACMWQTSADRQQVKDIKENL